MNGYRTVIVSVATVLLGILEGQHMTALVAQYPGTFATTIGIVMLVLRWLTTSPIFKG